MKDLACRPGQKRPGTLAHSREDGGEGRRVALYRGTPATGIL
jgi:hypothetical protein